MPNLKITLPSLFLIIFGLLVLNSIAHFLFPTYFLYVLLALLTYFFISKVDFGVISLFSRHLYIMSIVLLIITLVIGQVTRGAIRWIPIGKLTIQTSEIARPLLLVFFANFLTQKELNLKILLKALLLLVLPFILILVQPSLGVALLTIIGFLGVFLAASFDKKYLFLTLLGGLALIPLFWFVLAPYQKTRILTFLNPNIDPKGAGYNAIQSLISVGSGKLTGRGLGRGVQTQLSFLPERQTDFIFASIAEEMGFVGAALLLLVTFYLLNSVLNLAKEANSPAGRAFISGLFLTYFAQVFVHVGMNMGLFPITGVPYPLVSAGGSSLLATMMGLGIAVGMRKK